jgi:hypothetical protein
MHSAKWLSVIFFVGVTITPPLIAAEWAYDWNTRLDRDNKPVGVFETTPFPIDEFSTSYSITTDEGVKTFHLGTKYFVDGAYTGGGSDGSWARPWTKINDAISRVPAGNITIVVRGAHGSFSGLYHETGLIPKAGADDQHRWMIVGYAQERPVIDGSYSRQDIIQTSYQLNGYVTIQRLRIQNNFRDGVHWGGDPLVDRDRFNNLIDVSVTNCAAEVAPQAANGNIYFLNADYGWVYHVTSTHTLRHCVKVGDNTSNTIVEWTEAGECGYWEGIAAEKGITDYRTQVLEFPEALNFPNDAGHVGANNTARYNIAHDGLYGGVQIRNSTNFSFHHNEVYNSPRFSASNMGLSCDMGDPPCSQVQLIGYPMGGNTVLDNVKVHSNVIRDAGESSPTSCGLGTNSLSNNHSVYIYNNLFYNNGGAEIRLYGSSAYTTRQVHIYNNTLWHKSPTATLFAPTNWGAGEILVKNNILTQHGSGKVLDLDPRVRDIDYNLYYFPSGSRGFTAGPHDFAAGASVNPMLAFGPTGTPLRPLGDVAETSVANDQGIDLSQFFNTDFAGTLRPQGRGWDLGIRERVVVPVPDPVPIPTQSPAPEHTRTGFTPFKNVLTPSERIVEITYSLPAESPVDIKLYDSRGQLIRPLIDNGGRAVWDGRNESGETVAAGVYLVILKTREQTLRTKVVVLK